MRSGAFELKLSLFMTSGNIHGQNRTVGVLRVRVCKFWITRDSIYSTSTQDPKTFKLRYVDIMVVYS